MCISKQWIQTNQEHMIRPNKCTALPREERIYSSQFDLRSEYQVNGELCPKVKGHESKLKETTPFGFKLISFLHCGKKEGGLPKYTIFI